MIKPQFAAGKDHLVIKAVDRERQMHDEVMHKVIDYAHMIGFEVRGLTYSPIKGPEGNIEYLVCLQKRTEIPEEITAMTEAEAERALHVLTEEGRGRSHEADMKEMISHIAAQAHGALDEAK